MWILCTIDFFTGCKSIIKNCTIQFFTQLLFLSIRQFVDVKMLQYWLKTDRGSFLSRLYTRYDLYLVLGPKVGTSE